MLGPERAEHSWDAPLQKYLDRARLWGRLGAGLFLTGMAYTIYVASVLMFIGQLEPLPRSFPDFEKRACAALFPGPGNWITVPALKGLRHWAFPGPYGMFLRRSWPLRPGFMSTRPRGSFGSGLGLLPSRTRRRLPLASLGSVGSGGGGISYSLCTWTRLIARSNPCLPTCLPRWFFRRLVWGGNGRLRKLFVLTLVMKRTVSCAPVRITGGGPSRYFRGAASGGHTPCWPH